MSEKVEIEFIAGPTTPERYRNRVGTKTYAFDPGREFFPAPGTEGTLLGIPGIVRPGWKFEIADVDLRSETDKLLDAAEELLGQAPIAGEEIGVANMRLARAQHLLLKAQAKILRGGR